MNKLHVLPLIVVLPFGLLSAQLGAPGGVSRDTMPSEDVRFQNGGITLGGILMRPTSDRPVPAAVVLRGSGPSSRTNQWALAIASELLRNGVAVLLADKRGADGSGGDWRTATFDTLASDALAGVAFLRRRSEIDARRIGLVGLSQGGHIAPVAAARSNDVAFVIDVSGGATGFAEGTFVEMANTARQAGLSEAMIHVVIDMNQAAMRYATSGDWDAYVRARERGIETEARRIIAGFPSSSTDPIWTFFRGTARFDPLSYWLQVHQPVLVVLGELDEGDNVAVGESVRRLEHAFLAARKKNYRIEVIAGVGHDLTDHQSHSMARFNGILSSWIREHVTP